MLQAEQASVPKFDTHTYAHAVTEFLPPPADHIEVAVAGLRLSEHWLDVDFVCAGPSEQINRFADNASLTIGNVGPASDYIVVRNPLEQLVGLYYYTPPSARGVFVYRYPAPPVAVHHENGSVVAFFSTSFRVKYSGGPGTWTANLSDVWDSKSVDPAVRLVGDQDRVDHRLRRVDVDAHGQGIAR